MLWVQYPDVERDQKENIYSSLQKTFGMTPGNLDPYHSLSVPCRMLTQWASAPFADRSLQLLLGEPLTSRHVSMAIVDHHFRPLWFRALIRNSYWIMYWKKQTPNSEIFKLRKKTIPLWIKGMGLCNQLAVEIHWGTKKTCYPLVI